VTTELNGGCFRIGPRQRLSRRARQNVVKMALVLVPARHRQAAECRNRVSSQLNQVNHLRRSAVAPVNSQAVEIKLPGI
jgi:hypothetical protein